MIKCKNCGNNLQMEDAYCPYCGTQNPYFQKERDFMSNYQEEFHETKEDVYHKNSEFAKSKVTIIIIVTLALINVLLLFLIGNSWSMASAIEDFMVSINIDKHIEQLDTFESEGDFLAFSNYFQDHSFYGNDHFENYVAVYFCSANYASIYDKVMSLYLEDEIQARDFDMLADSIVDFYRHTIQDEYDNPDRFSGQHQISIQYMNQLISRLLHTYLNVSMEYIETFPSMNAGKISVILEEGYSHE